MKNNVVMFFGIFELHLNTLKIHLLHENSKNRGILALKNQQ